MGHRRSVVSFGRLSTRLGRIARFRIAAIIVAIALTIAPFGMIGMAETHAMAMSHEQTQMVSTAHCASQTNNDRQNPIESAADCIAACTGVAVCLSSLVIELTRTIETPGQSIVATPHEESLDFELPPPRIS